MSAGATAFAASVVWAGWILGTTRQSAGDTAAARSAESPSDEYNAESPFDAYATAFAGKAGGGPPISAATAESQWRAWLRSQA